MWFSLFLFYYYIDVYNKVLLPRIFEVLNKSTNGGNASAITSLSVQHQVRRVNIDTARFYIVYTACVRYGSAKKGGREVITFVYGKYYKWNKGEGSPITYIWVVTDVQYCISMVFIHLCIFSVSWFWSKRITLTTLGDQAISSIIFLSCSNLNMSLLALLSSV